MGMLVLCESNMNAHFHIMKLWFGIFCDFVKYTLHSNLHSVTKLHFTTNYKSSWYLWLPHNVQEGKCHWPFPLRNVYDIAAVYNYRHRLWSMCIGLELKRALTLTVRDCQIENYGRNVGCYWKIKNKNTKVTKQNKKLLWLWQSNGRGRILHRIKF